MFDPVSVPKEKKPKSPKQEGQLVQLHASMEEQEAEKAMQRLKVRIKEQKKNKALTRFPVEAFPERIQNIINCFWECYQLPIDYHASSILVAASTTIGNAFAIKYRNGQVYPLNIYMAVVGPPGIGKTPAINFGMYPLKKIEKRYRKSHQEAYDQWLQQAFMAKNQGNPAPAEPEPQEIIVVDATTESVNKTLVSNPKGVVLWQDELMGWIKNMNSYRKGADLEYYTSAWSGSSVKVSRAKGIMWIEYPFVNAVGGIQPDILKNMVAGERRENGFTDRILFAYPDFFEIPHENDMEPDESVYDLYEGLIEFLNKLPNKFEVEYSNNGATTTNVCRHVVPFSAAGKQRYVEYLNQLTDEQNQCDENQLKGILSKMKQYTARFALIMELLQLACNHTAKQGEPLKFFEVANKTMDKLQVSKQSVERAILLTEYYKSTAAKVVNELQSIVSQQAEYIQAWYEELPEEFPSELALEMAAKIEKEMSVKFGKRTVQRFLSNQKGDFFQRIRKGWYRKLVLS